MNIGIKGQKTVKVLEENTAKVMKSGSLPVYATPSMIALIEETAWNSVNDYLEEGQATVGTKLNISHLSSTPLGMEVRCNTELIEVDRKKLIFDVKVYDEVGLIGEGTHERFIINTEKFLKKTDSKKTELK